MTKPVATFNCAEEMELLYHIAEFLQSWDWRANTPRAVTVLRNNIDDAYPYFLDCYRVAKLMNPHNPNPTRSALRASRHRAARDRT